MSQDTLRTALADLPDNALLPVSWIRAHLPETATTKPGDSDVDLTVEHVAELFGRADSTIRTWIAQGVFPSAYRLRGREWRIPRSDLVAHQQQQREASKPAPPATATNADADLSAWRKHIKRQER